MSPLSLRDYLDAYRLSRRASYVHGENAVRSFSLEEITPLLPLCGGTTGLLIGGCAHALLRVEHGLEPRRIKDIDVVASPDQARGALEHPGARVFVRHKSKEERARFVFVALQVWSHQRLRLPSTDPDLNGFAFRYAKVELPTGLSHQPVIDVDLLLSTCRHVSTVDPKIVRFGGHALRVPSPESLLCEAFEVLALEQRNLTHPDPDRRERVERRFIKHKGRVISALEIWRAAGRPSNDALAREFERAKPALEQAGLHPDKGF